METGSIPTTEEKSLELEPDHRGANKRKTGKQKSTKRKKKKAKKKKIEYFPLRSVKRAKDVNKIHTHKQFLKGSAIISIAA